MIGIHAKLDIGFEIVVVEIAASKVRRAGQNERRTFLAPKNQHLAVALLAASVAPAHGNVGGVQLPGDLAVGHAILLAPEGVDRKSTRLNSSHVAISYAVFCLKKKKEISTEVKDTHNELSY